MAVPCPVLQTEQKAIRRAAAIRGPVTGKNVPGKGDSIQFRLTADSTGIGIGVPGSARAASGAYECGGPGIRASILAIRRAGERGALRVHVRHAENNNSDKELPCIQGVI